MGGADQSRDRKNANPSRALRLQEMIATADPWAFKYPSPGLKAAAEIVANPLHGNSKPIASASESE